jgi:enoyl-CoA hydratase/carnithine racemase
MAEALAAELTQLDADGDLRIAVVTGGHGFCAGMDLRALLPASGRRCPG